MKNWTIVLTLFLSISFSNLLAQSVDVGAKLYDNADYKGAIAELDKALEGDKLKDKALVKGYYYRALSKLVLVRKNKDFKEPATEKLVREYAITGFEDLIQAEKHDTDAKMKAEIAGAQEKMQEYIHEIAEQTDLAIKMDGSKTEAEKKEMAESIIAMCAPLMAKDKFNYLNYALTADAQLYLGQEQKALENYHLADDWFFRSAPKNGDQAIGYVYIHIAELEWKLNKNYEVANAALQEGKEVVSGETKKTLSLGNASATTKAHYSERQGIILTDINKAELDLKKAAGKE